MANSMINTLGQKAAVSLSAGLVTGLNNAAKYVGAGQRANSVSAAAQAAAGNFNQASANNANAINSQTLANQYAFNSGGANLANDYSTQSWNQAAAWNEEMFEKQMAFNAEQAQLQRDWAERMDNTKYQRAMQDMKAGGLNPILAYGGINSSASGSAASVSAPQMGFAHGAQPSGGLLGANDASISGYTGQMEYYAGLMGMIGNFMNSISSAYKNMAGMPAQTLRELGSLLDKQTWNPKDWLQADEGSIGDKILNGLGIPHSTNPQVGQRGYTKGYKEYYKY